MRLAKTAEIVEAGVGKTLSYYSFPPGTGARSAPTTRWNG